MIKTKTVILAVGPRTLSLAKEVAKNKADGEVCVVNARSLKPLDENMLDKIKDKRIITLEENSEIGGFGAFVCDHFAVKGKSANVAVIGIKDKFVPHGTVDSQLKKNGLSVDNILKFC